MRWLRVFLTTAAAREPSLVYLPAADGSLEASCTCCWPRGCARSRGGAEARWVACKHPIPRCLLFNVTGYKAAITGKCCFSLAAAEAATCKDSQISPIDSYFKRCPIDMCLEGHVGRLGEDPGPHLLLAAGQRTLLWIGSCSVSCEMFQSQVTTNIFQSAVEVLVLLQWARHPFPLSC